LRTNERRQDIQFIAAILADSAGNYSLNPATNTYVVLAANPGYVSDLTVAPMVMLNCGQVLTEHLTLPANSNGIS